MKNKSTISRNTACFFSLIVLLLGTGSCYSDKAELLYPGSNAAVDCSTIQAKFASNVQPLILSKCSSSGCHDAAAAGGIVLLTYNDISSAKERVSARAVVQKTMPSTGALLPAEINILKCWISSGAPNN